MYGFIGVGKGVCVLCMLCVCACIAAVAQAQGEDRAPGFVEVKALFFIEQQCEFMCGKLQ